MLLLLKFSMKLIFSTHVFLNRDGHFDSLSSQSVDKIEKSLLNNGFKNILDEQDGLIKVFERPGNKKSTYQILMYKNTALIQTI